MSFPLFSVTMQHSKAWAVEARLRLSVKAEAQKLPTVAKMAQNLL